MPRKPIGDVAMTGAERLRRWRERKRAERPDASLSDRQKLAQAQAEIVWLRKQQAAATRQEPAKAAPAQSQELVKARKEIAALTAELAAAKERIKQMAADQMAQTQRFRDLLKQRDANPKPAKPAPKPLDPDSALARARAENKTLRRKVKYLGERYEERLEHKGHMPRETRNAIEWVLQPDQRRNVTEERWDEAAKRWNAWKNAYDKAAR